MQHQCEAKVYVKRESGASGAQAVPSTTTDKQMALQVPTHGRVVLDTTAGDIEVSSYM